MSRIFLSHSSANNGPAVAVRDWLKAEGWDDVFLDVDPERGINPGERWEKALNQAAYRCEAVLFLVSRAWLKSSWCLKEFDLAAKLNKRMFGVLIEDIEIAELPSQLTGTWQIVNLAKGADQRPFESTTPDGQVHYGTFSQGALRRLKEGLVKAGLDPRFFDWPPAGDPKRSPYHGLLPMEADDAGIFYGREAPIIETLDKLRGLRQVAASRLLVILGASGSGKSSFLRAGIMPRLARDDRNFLVLPVVRPQRAVLSGETGLFRCLEKAGEAQGLKWTRTEIRKAAAADAKGLLALLATLARQATPPRLDGEEVPRPPSLVLAIDQAEELLQAEGGEEAQNFRSLLKNVLADEDANLIVLFTIRSDAYAALQGDPLLKDIHQQPLNLPPVPRGAYQTIIEGPASRLAGTERALKIDPQLTAALLEDIEAGGAKDALPLLAFTLERLYVEQGGDGDLRLEEYRELGGIAGSIEAAVEQALRAADADPAVPKDRAARLALLRRAFIPWLAGIDPDTGTPRRSIARLSDMPEEAMPLVRHLIEQRLLSTDRSAEGEQTIEPAHEALLRQWGMLKGWLVEDSALLAALEGVKRATRDWLANNKSPDWLAHGAGRLEDAERLKTRPDLISKMAKDDLDYLNLCRVAETEHKDRELRQARKLARAKTQFRLIAAVFLAAVVIGFGYNQFERANKAQEEARAAFRYAEEIAKEKQRAENQAEAARQEKERAIYNEGIALSGLSRVALSEGDPAQAIKLALAAWPRQKDSERPALRRTIESLAAAMPQNHEHLLLKGHASQIYSALFSRDGTRILTASKDGTARLWDVKTGTEIAILKGHGGAVYSAAFSRDETRIVTASEDNTARLWDMNTGNMIVLKGHSGAVDFAEFSPDGKSIMTASRDNTVRLWDVQTGAEITVLVREERSFDSLTISSDGTRMAATTDVSSVLLWDAKTGVGIATLQHSNFILSLTFTPDGTKLVTASADGTAVLWDAKTGAEIAVLKGHDSWLNTAAFSSDGMLVVTASFDGTARIWNAITGSQIIVLKGRETSFGSAVFSPDGARVLTASNDNTARLWDAKTGAQVAIFRASIDSAAFSPDGTCILTTSGDGAMRLWSARVESESAVLKGHEDHVGSVAFSPDGTRVVTASSDNTARLWDARTGTEIAVLKGHTNTVQSAVFSPDGARILTASHDITARLWDAKTGAEIGVSEGHWHHLQSAVFSPDGARFVTASADKTARLYDTKTGTELSVLQGHEGSVNSAVFSPDGTQVVTASWDGTARLWESKTGNVIAILKGHESAVNSAVFSPDGTRIVTASSDNTARLWDAKKGTEISVFKGHEHSVSSAVFSPDGTRVVTASDDNTARLWDVKKGREIAVLKGHGSKVNSAVFAPSGLRIVTASDDETVRFWDAETGTEIAAFKGGSAAFSPDGTRVATTSSDHIARIWDISNHERGDAFAIACRRLGNDTDLADVRERHGLSEMVPICGENAPLPVDLGKVQ